MGNQKPLTEKPWKELERERVFEKFGRGMDRVAFELPDGSKKDYYVKNEKPTVAIFAITNDGKVILVEQFRPGPKRVIRELPGGFVDPQETPEQAAERELLEETGYSGSLQPLFSFNDCAYSTRVRHCFLATDCKRDVGNTSVSNEGRLVLTPLASFEKWMMQEPMTDVACALAGLLKLADSMAQSEFIEYLKRLEPEDWEKRATEKWTVKDVVAHMVGWERDDPEAIRKAWETKEPPWWMKTKDYDAYNQRNVEQYRSYAPLQLIEEWEHLQRKVQEEIDRIGADNLKKHPELFGWLFEGDDKSKDRDHYHHHLQQIKKAVEG